MASESDGTQHRSGSSGSPSTNMPAADEQSSLTDSQMEVDVRPSADGPEVVRQSIETHAPLRPWTRVRSPSPALSRDATPLPGLQGRSAAQEWAGRARGTESRSRSNSTIDVRALREDLGLPTTVSPEAEALLSLQDSRHAHPADAGRAATQVRAEPRPLGQRTPAERAEPDRPADSEEYTQWKAAGKPDCPGCHKKHPPPCDPAKSEVSEAMNALKKHIPEFHKNLRRANKIAVRVGKQKRTDETAAGPSGPKDAAPKERRSAAARGFKFCKRCGHTHAENAHTRAPTSSDAHFPPLAGPATQAPAGTSGSAPTGQNMPRYEVMKHLGNNLQTQSGVDLFLKLANDTTPVQYPASWGTANGQQQQQQQGSFAQTASAGADAGTGPRNIVAFRPAPTNNASQRGRGSGRGGSNATRGGRGGSHARGGNTTTTGTQRAGDTMDISDEGPDARPAESRGSKSAGEKRRDRRRE